MEKHFAVIGDPVAHSLSPIMHRSGYKAVGLAAEYQKFLVKPGNLREAVTGLQALGFTGWNVTVPHKEAIIPYLDELTPEAGQAAAVNTVKVEDGRLIGHNTDGAGFVLSIKSEMPVLKGKKAVLLGAGGAAKGIAFALMREGMELYILNRSQEKAESLAESILEWGGKASYGEWGPGEWLETADLLVQTTSLGLHHEEYPFSLKGISPHTLVVDIIFNPWETPFLRDAQEQGCRVLNGLGMLLYQGVLAWEFWLGVQAPVEHMRAALLEAVQAK